MTDIALLLVLGATLIALAATMGIIYVAKKKTPAQIQDTHTEAEEETKEDMQLLLMILLTNSTETGDIRWNKNEKGTCYESAYIETGPPLEPKAPKLHFKIHHENRDSEKPDKVFEHFDTLITLSIFHEDKVVKQITNNTPNKNEALKELWDAAVKNETQDLW